jgi:hypothetical protein
MLLNTKIQHKNFEAGEFVDVRLRTYEETIACIESFPWQSERERIQISLTNPSITLEAGFNNFLKFALFYNGKFVLHYFNTEKELYTKSVYKIEEAYPYIKNLYESEIFDLHDFKKEPTWMQHNLIHFVTQDFHYSVTPRRIKQYLVESSGINFAMSVFFILMMLFSGGGKLTPLQASGFLLFYFFFFGGGINLIIFRNYYLFAKGKILIMSKGNDVFYFGNELNPKKYDKHDILQVTIYSPGNYRNPASLFSVVKIEFKNEETIQIPNIFVSKYAIEDKLYQCPQVQKSKLQLVKRES